MSFVAAEVASSLKYTMLRWYEDFSMKCECLLSPQDNFKWKDLSNKYTFTSPPGKI